MKDFVITGYTIPLSQKNEISLTITATGHIIYKNRELTSYDYAWRKKMGTANNKKVDYETADLFIKRIPSEKIIRAIVLSLKGQRGNSCPAQNISKNAYTYLDFNIPTKYRELIMTRIWDEVELLLECNALEQYQTNKMVRIKLHEKNLPAKKEMKNHRKLRRRAFSICKTQWQM